MWLSTSIVLRRLRALHLAGRGTCGNKAGAQEGPSCGITSERRPPEHRGPSSPDLPGDTPRVPFPTLCLKCSKPPEKLEGSYSDRHLFT